MSYYPTSPQANDDPRVSQAELQSNNSKINSDLSVNHQPLTTTQNPGYHTKIFFPNGVSDPNLAAPICSLYPKLVSGKAELFFQNGNTSDDVYQLTGLTITTVGTEYSLTTPWRMQFNFGLTSGVNTVYATPFPGGTIILSTQLTGVTAVNPKLTVSSITNLTYTVTEGLTAYYFVIGLLP